MKSLIERYGKMNLIMVGVTIVTTIIAIIMGIYAVQTAMKMKLSFSINPTVKVQIYASETGADGTWTTLFNNASATGEIANGWTLNGNTLTCTSAMTELAGAQYFKITNCNTDADLLTNISVNDNAGTNYVATKNSGTVTTAQIVSLSKISFDFQKVAQITVNNSHSTISSTSNNIITYDSKFYAALGTTASITFAGVEHYQAPSNATATGVQSSSYANGTITLTTIQSDVTVTVISGSVVKYTITYNAQGGSGLSSTTVLVDYNGTYTLPTGLTKSWFSFEGWATTAGATSGVTGEQTCQGDKTWYAAWKELIYTIYSSINGTTTQLKTYTPSSNVLQIPNLTAPGNSGTFTSFNAWMPKGSVAGITNPTEANTPTMSGTTLTIPANVSGDITIYPKGYSILQYGASGAATVPNTGWTGYYYVVFNGAEYYNDSGTNRPLRWIIIGAGSSKQTYLSSSQVPSTAKTQSTSELGANQVLLLSEQTVEAMAFDKTNGSGDWTASTSDIRLWLNNGGTFLTSTGMQNYVGTANGQAKTIQPQVSLKTAWQGNATTSSLTATTNQTGFLLALEFSDTLFVAYQYQNFTIQDYLGTVNSSNLKARSFSGASKSYWWLRSGSCYDDYYAYYVDDDGDVHDRSVYYYDRAVRPSFVLNLGV